MCSVFELIFYLISFILHQLVLETRGYSGVADVGKVNVPIPGGNSIPLEQSVLQSFENWRGVMLKGSMRNEIPFLDPFVFPLDIPIRFPHPFSPKAGTYELIISKLTFRGLSTFKVKSLSIDPLSRDMSFENYIGNMSATSDYNLKYYATEFLPFPLTISKGSAYGAIYGSDLIGTGTLLPTPPNWFKLAKIAMTYSFESLDIRIYPEIPFVDQKLQNAVSQEIYDGIQRLKPNMSQLSTTTYSKTVELKLS